MLIHELTRLTIAEVATKLLSFLHEWFWNLPVYVKIVKKT